MNRILQDSIPNLFDREGNRTGHGHRKMQASRDGTTD